MSIIAIPGVLELIESDEGSSGNSQAIEKQVTPGMNTQGTASSIIESAHIYQTQASGSRLAQTPIAYSQKGLAGLKSRNLDIAARIKAERKVKSEEAKLLDVGIRVTASLWQESGNKIEQIKAFQSIERFDPNLSTKAALDTLLVGLRTDFQTKNPSTEQLTWANVSIHAHENQTKFSSLRNFDRTLPLSQLYKAEFVKKKIGAQKKLENREIEIRLMYLKSDIFKLGSADPEAEFVQDDSDDEDFSQAGSKGVFASALPCPSAAPVYLRSAWKPKAVTNRPLVQTTACQFIRSTASYKSDACQVELQFGNIEETINISTEWEKGQAGYIGTRFTKRGIYAQFGGIEYVITQPMEGTAENVKLVLEEEYKLLCQGHAFKLAFDEHAKDQKILAIPKFYFNFPSSILGELVPSVSSQSRLLPYRHFLATPLLPCGEADPKIKKFTGNDQVGPAEDNLTQAIHAFAHFSVIYSQKNLLFCDLQGTPDQKNIMCLIDPQCHTSEDPKKTVYWDGGISKIDEFLKEHGVACDTNWVCKALKLKDIVVRSKTPESNRSNARQASKSSLSYITHDR
ncbi:hypothetical protein BYT27DRAFT_7208000 [Phlegmacium glaucopus]|nr:hypothetical protein BYT27DRAFT_7208000 [Phlegmacium glaucopus]